MKQRYDLPLKCQQLEVRDAAWLHNPQTKKGLSPKLQRPWQGPYTVIKRNNDLVYQIQLGPKTKPKVVHRNRLWRYSGVNAPTWYKASATGESASPSPTGQSASPSATGQSASPSATGQSASPSLDGQDPPPSDTEDATGLPDGRLGVTENYTPDEYDGHPGSPSGQPRRSNRSRHPPDRYGT